MSRRPLSPRPDAKPPLRTASKAAEAEAELAELARLIHQHSPEALQRVAAHPRLNEDLALALLGRRDLDERVLNDLARNHSVMKSRKVLNALVRHARTPRHVTVPLVRRLFTFELMELALTPALAADLKMVAEEALRLRLEAISAGERLTLARRASARVAAALLLDTEARVVEAALDNPFLTEAFLVKAVLDPDAPAHFIHGVCRHRKWSLRREIKCALLRSQHTPLAQAIAIAHSLRAAEVREALEQSLLAENIRVYLLQLKASQGGR